MTPTALRLYDAHNHLQDERFAGLQEQLLAACRTEGVLAMVVNGSSSEDWEAVAELSRRHPDQIRPAFGVHPWYVEEQPADWETRLLTFLDHFPGASIGESGLDRWRRRVDFGRQLEFFRRHLVLAAAYDRPLSIHCLQAWGALYDALRTGPRPRRGFLLHSFGGPREMIEPLARLGARFSLPGYFARPDKERQRENFRHVPLDRLLIETDAPYQCLPPDRVAYPLPPAEGGRPLNHPANLGAVYRFAAELLGLPLEELTVQVEANFQALFG